MACQHIGGYYYICNDQTLNPAKTLYLQTEIKKETKKDGITLYENHLNSIITSQFSTSVKSTPSRPPQRRTLYPSYHHSSRRKHRRGMCRGDCEVPLRLFPGFSSHIFPLLKRNTSPLCSPPASPHPSKA